MGMCVRKCFCCNGGEVGNVGGGGVGRGENGG